MMDTQGGFFCLPPEVLTALGVVAGYALVGDLTADQMGVLGNVLILMGQILATVSAQEALLQGQGQDKELQALWAAVRELQEKLGE